MKRFFGMVIVLFAMFTCVVFADTFDVTDVTWWRDGAEGAFSIILDAEPLGVSFTTDGARNRRVPTITVPVGTRLLIDLPPEGFWQGEKIFAMFTSVATAEMTSIGRGQSVDVTFDEPSHYGFQIYTGILNEVANVAWRIVETTPDTIFVRINGTSHWFAVPPVIIDGRTMLPLRAIGEALGMEVGFDDETNTAKLNKPGLQITHEIGTNAVNVNSVTAEFDAKSVIVDSRTLMPVRMLSEAIGAAVDWDAGTRTVHITTPTQ